MLKKTSNITNNNLTPHNLAAPTCDAAHQRRKRVPLRHGKVDLRKSIANQATPLNDIITAESAGPQQADGGTLGLQVRF